MVSVRQSTRSTDQAVRSADALARPFPAIIFDWDGTAVANRRERADALITLAEALLARGVWLVVITGTNYGNVDRQFCSRLAPSRRQHLLVCTNRGSEVFGFDSRGRRVRQASRVATPAEERALTAVAEGVRDAVRRRTGLEVDIVYDRLNRRKIDLIPLPEWQDPPKDRIGDLLAAVEERLRSAGWTGGLGAAIHLTQRFSQEHGLDGARITSDVKHIEVGLTDKGDSLDWIRREHLAPRGIADADVLIVGDEFGPVGGFVGSDDRLRAEGGDAVVVSVGPEPNGVPSGVLHLGGGPARFRALLADQVWRHERMRQGAAAVTEDEFPQPVDPDWRLSEAAYRPEMERQVEARFTLSNGFYGVRASLLQPTDASDPRTLVAGLFDTPDEPNSVPGLVDAPNWLEFRLSVDGQLLAMDRGRTVSHRRTLDLARGILHTDWEQEDPSGRRVRLRGIRFASMADRSLAVEAIRLETDHPVAVEIEASLGEPGPGLVPERSDRDATVWRVAHGRTRLAAAHRVQLRVGSTVLPARHRDGQARWSWVATPDQPALFWRVVAAERGEADDLGRRVRARADRAGRAGLGRLVEAHARAWAERWRASDIAIAGDDEAQRGLRFALYHLNGAANPADERVAVGARGLTGDAYRGHVFWDTDIFLLPFYTFTWPEAARAMLTYRHHTLPAARAKARRMGYRGALYAWESTDSGEEATPPSVVLSDGTVVPVLCGTQEQHISADVAYAVWLYWQATGDDRFLLESGAEIVLETARFWASRAAHEADGRYHIRGVIGPDEYHEVIDDSVYTNELARWNLERGVEMAHLLADRWPARWEALSRQLELDGDELASWLAVAAGLAVEVDPSTGLVEEFAGFWDLEPLDLADYASPTVPMDVLLGRERTQRTQVVKQADVVMLMALLWDRFPAAVREANFRYYAARCGHGSSLSPATHAAVAARLGDAELALRYLHQAVALDTDDSMGNAAGGVHIGAHGGLWQAVAFGFGGLSLGPDGLALDPRLPEAWQALRFPVSWRGRNLSVEIERHSPLALHVALERGEPMTVTVGSVDSRLSGGERHSWSYNADTGEWRAVEP